MTLETRRPPSIAAPGGNPTTRSSAHFARVPIGRGLGANGLPSLRTTELTRVARELDDRRRALDAREIAVRARERAALGADALDNALRRSDDDDDETRGFANSRRRDDDGETRETRETRRLRGVVGALEPALLDATRAARLAKRREHTVIARSEDAARSHARAETRLATRLRETEEALVKVTEERKALRARLAAAKARREKTDAAAAATAEKLAARERVAEDMRRDHESLMRQLLDAASLDERRVAEAANEAVAEARRGENDAKATTRAFAVKMKRAEEENRALTRRCRTVEEQVEFCLASIREDERRELKKAKGGGEAEEEEGDGDVAADENENENENEIEDEIAGNKARSIHWFPYDRVGVVNADP
jgi:chromosome segregation ATPase